jgi:pimeloyl-ACP methyl ester carboxylesterase
LNWIIVLYGLVVIIFPTIVLGEILYNIPRKFPYHSLPGFESVKILSNDGVKLQLWVSPHKSSNLLIVVHGHRDHSGVLYKRIQPLAEESRMDTIYLDLRNHGRSGIKRPVTVGIDEQKDVKAALKWAQNQNKWQSISLYGTSMGSAAVILIENDIHDQISSIIVDSVFIDHKKVIFRNLILYFVTAPWALLIGLYLLKVRYRKPLPNIRSHLVNFKTKTLICIGQFDFITPISILNEIDQLKSPNIKTLKISKGLHSRLHRHKAYREAFIEFFNEVSIVEKTEIKD